jgi:signal peptidase I
MVTARQMDQYNRGDIIVFEFPSDRTRLFIKRIVGLPSETIEIKDGKVFINEAPLDEPYVLEVVRSNFLKTVVPPQSFYVLGDNRRSSNDSRSWGPVPQENIRGVVRP